MKIKTRRIARSGERTFSKSGRVKETKSKEEQEAKNFEEYENDVLDRRLSQFKAFRD